jgi:CheY-like chemotaxis protein
MSRYGPRHLRLIGGADEGTDGRQFEAENDQDTTRQTVRERPSQVIIDVGMPVWQGLELVRRMHADPGLRGAHVEVVAALQEFADDGLISVRLRGKASALAAALWVVDEVMSGPVPPPGRSRKADGWAARVDVTCARLKRCKTLHDDDSDMMRRARDQMVSSRDLLLATRSLVAQLG